MTRNKINHIALFTAIDKATLQLNFQLCRRRTDITNIIDVKCSRLPLPAGYSGKAITVRAPPARTAYRNKLRVIGIKTFDSKIIIQLNATHLCGAGSLWIGCNNTNTAIFWRRRNQSYLIFYCQLNIIDNKTTIHTATGRDKQMIAVAVVLNEVMLVNTGF